MRWVCALLVAGLLIPASAAAQPRLSRDIYGYSLTLDAVDDALAVRSAGGLVELAPSGATAVPWQLDAPNCTQDQQTYAVRCPAGQVPLSISAGAGADTIDGSASPLVLTITGGAGADTLTGGPGDDRFSVRDNEADTVRCGPGSDSVVADAADSATECESVDVPATSSPPPPAESPTAGPTSSPPAIDAKVSSTFAAGRASTRVLKLSVTGAPSGATIRLTCTGKKSGCPKKSVTRSGTSASFAKLFKTARLRVGTVLEVRVTAPGRVGRVVRFTTRRGKAPKRVVLCVAPGSAAPKSCG